VAEAQSASTTEPGEAPDQGQSTAQRTQQPAQLQEVIVTAQKRREPLMQVPVTVTVVSGEALEKRHEVSMEDYLSQIPGVSVQEANGGQLAISMRGIGSSAFLAPTVGIELDGIPIGSSNAAGNSELRPDIEPSDLENIQALYGPQGTLYGADAMGGLIMFTTLKPQLDQFSGRVEADGSSVYDGGYGSGQRVMLNAPLIDGTLAVRVSGYLRHDPGYIDDAQTGVDNINDGSSRGGRFDVLWQITNNASLRLNALAQDSNANGDNGEIVTPSGQSVYGDLKTNGFLHSGEFFTKYRFYTGTLDVDLGWAHLASLSGYSTTYNQSYADLTQVFGPILGTPPYIGFSLVEGYGTRKFSQEIRLTSPTNQRLEWIGGLFYTREATSGAQLITAFDSQTGGPPATVPSLIGQVLAEPTIFREYAAYGDLTYHITSSFDFQAGGRYSHELQDIPEQFVLGLLGSPPSPANGQNDDSSTFLAAARYHFTQSQMAYLRVASGYRPGGANSVLAGVPSTYGPDKTVDYELGFKGGYLDRRLDLQAALFYIDWTDIQMQVLNQFQEAYVVNGNKAKSQGAQFTAQYLIGHGLSASANIVYTDAALVQAGPASSGAAAGAPLPFANKWGGDLILQERFPVTARWRGSTELIYDYFGDRYGSFNSAASVQASLPQVFLPAYSTVDLLGGLGDGRYSINLFVRNLTDKRAFSNMTYEGGGVLGDRSVGVVTPRTIGISVAAEF
jgi:iron complex outermembrane recepter protein